MSDSHNYKNEDYQKLKTLSHERHLYLNLSLKQYYCEMEEQKKMKAIMEKTMEILSIKRVTEILGYKSRRSALRWCINNGVEIFSYHGSARKYVLKAQFEWVRYKKMFSKLVKKTPELSQHLPGSLADI